MQDKYSTKNSNIPRSSAPLQDTSQQTQKKKPTKTSLFEAALFLIRRRSKAKPNSTIQIDVASKNMVDKVVGSMRPFHLQVNQSSTCLETKDNVQPKPVDVSFEDVVPYPMSPSVASTSDGYTSRYASASNLQELDEDGDCEHYEPDGGDHMIDLKAEQFIEQFYQEIQIQNQTPHHRQ